MHIEKVSPGPVGVGSHYRSLAHVNGIPFTAEFQVTKHQPPAHFAFTGHDQTGRFEHQFTFQPYDNGTRITRQVNFALTLRQWLMFAILIYPVRLPAAKKALRQLKQRLERTTA
jgi:hypothetical protein